MTYVRDIMTPNPQAVTDQTLASEAAKIMRDFDIGVLPVMQDGRLEGVVTDRDLTIEVLAQRGDAPVREIMTRNVVTISPNDEVERAEQLMSEHGIRRLMVCDGTTVVGVVSVGDLAVQVSDALAGEVVHETGPHDRQQGFTPGSGSFAPGQVGQEQGVAGQPGGQVGQASFGTQAGAGDQSGYGQGASFAQQQGDRPESDFGEENMGRTSGQASQSGYGQQTSQAGYAQPTTGQGGGMRPGALSGDQGLASDTLGDEDVLGGNNALGGTDTLSGDNTLTGTNDQDAARAARYAQESQD